MTEPKRKRWTLRQLADKAKGEDAWSCRVCGCRDWRVSNTYINGGVRKRNRICRNCGEPLATIEIPVQDDDTDQ
jgi:transcription elongation factor Elf1